MTNHQKRINQFMKLAGQEVKDSPSMPDKETLRLRAKLIFEECMETINAMGFDIQEGEIVDTDHEPDFIEISDGIADISVVSIGTLSAMGIDDEPLLTEVDQNNLKKFGPGSYIREDGKLVKPPGHMPPDIEGVLVAQGWGR